jgi:hypothetical protein
MPLSESDYYLAFHYCKGTGPKRFDEILEIFGSVGKAWNTSTTK